MNELTETTEAIDDAQRHRLIEFAVNSFLKDRIKACKHNLFIAACHFAPATTVVVTAMQTAYNTFFSEVVVED